MSVLLLNCDVFEGLEILADDSVNCVVTSPPYWGLRDYGTGPLQIGRESTLQEHIDKLVAVFREVWRVIREDGTLWLNYGDSYAMSTRGAGGAGKQHTNEGSKLVDRRSSLCGYKAKDLMLMPARLALALQADGWYIRSEIIWHKPNPMPESVSDRPTNAHEKLFLLSKSPRYFYDADAVKEVSKAALNGNIRPRTRPTGLSYEQAGKAGLEGKCGDSEFRNLRNVWTIATAPYKGAHFATFPPKLIEPCIKAGCPVGGTVLDPFGGSGTTGMVARQLNRNAILIELSREYATLCQKRIADAKQHETGRRANASLPETR